jgi:DNA polymerase-3 subunit gamma/tau
MGQALYRKYRSKNLAEVIGQEHVIETLQKALEIGKISHAYLFTGPRGVGKTSVARIMAHEVNELPYTDESAHLDIIEIDAASNRRIDEIRDLRERVHIAPAAARYKVYIIDEVHMLTKEAFNALLKTLEEPPPHVIFILATTEAHKLPETIVSRTQRFSFKPVSSIAIVEHLKSVAKKEKIDVSTEALELIAQHADGSVRDSLSLFDQLAANGKAVSEKAVRQVLGIPKKASVNQLVMLIAAGQSEGAISALEKLREQGINPAIIAKELAAALRKELINGDGAEWTVTLLRRLLSVSASDNPHDDLEISLLEAASANRQYPHAKQTIAKSAEAKVAVQSAIVKKAQPSKNSGFSLKNWADVLNYFKEKNRPLYSVLRLAKPVLDGDTLTLVFAFQLHQKRVDQMKHKRHIGQAIEQLTGEILRVKCVVDKAHFSDESSVIAKRSQNASVDHSLETISNIFGRAEMLES